MKTAGPPLDKVVVHNHLIGGGFGRRLEIDGIVRAVEIAKHVGGPVARVTRGRYPARYVPALFLDRISAGSMRKECLSPEPSLRRLDHRQMASSRIQQWSRSRHDRGRDQSDLCRLNLHVEYLR